MKKRFIAQLAALFTLVGLAVVAGPANPAQAFIGVYRVSNVSANNAVSPKNATVSCFAGDDLLGVGGRINTGFGDVLLTRVYADAGLTTATAWGIEAIATAVAWEVEVFATCVAGGTVTNLGLFETVTASNPNDKFPLVACPAGQNTFGGGYRLFDANGLVAIDELRFNSALTTVQATSYNYGAVGNYELTVQAICGDPVPVMYLETWPSASNAVSPKTESSPACGGGEQISGVGAVITGGLGNVSIATLNPRPALLAGEATAREIGAYANNWEVEVQGVCVG